MKHRTLQNLRNFIGDPTMGYDHCVAHLVFQASEADHVTPEMMRRVWQVAGQDGPEEEVDVLAWELWFDFVYFGMPNPFRVWGEAIRGAQ